MATPQITALPPAPQRSDTPAVFITKADAFVAALQPFGTQANALAIDANTSATTATTQAAAASASASAASASATNANTSANNALTSANNAATSLTNFKNLYYGAAASAPTLRPDGSAMVVGDLYFDSTLSQIRVRQTSSWVSIPVALTGSTTQDFSAQNLSVISQNNGQLAGLRNRVINGDMRIDQRNNGAAVTPSTTFNYIVDRHYSVTTTPSKLTLQQVADAPPGFKYSTKITVASQFSPAAGDEFSFRQAIEGQNIVDFQFGSATAQTITYSLWVKGSVAGTYSIYVVSSSRSYIGTITVTNAWTKQLITLVADTTGTWTTDNTAGVYLGIDLGSGSNSNQSAGSWVSSNARRTTGSVTFVNQIVGSTLNITGIQLELGAFSTPFEQRSIGTELALCQRYYQVITSSMGGLASPGVTNLMNIPFPVAMRISPTCTSVTVLNNNTTGANMSTVNNTTGQHTSAGVSAAGYVSAATGKYDAEL